MNAWTWPLAAAAAGVALGLGGTWWEFHTEPPAAAEVPNGEAPQLVVAQPDSRGQAKVVVEGGERYDFGSMQRGETLSHTFVIKNVGQAPLTLTPGQPSCSCTVAKLTQNLLAPGESAELVLEWTAKSYASDFSQGLDLHTSDPDRQTVPIAVHGRVVQAARPVPDELNVGRLTASEPSTYVIAVLSFREGEFSIAKAECEQTESAEFFDFRFEPLSDEPMLAEAGAKGGVKVVVTVKPGLPLGPIQQTIRLTTNQSDLAPLEVPIRGVAVSEVSFIAGRNFDPDHNLLTLDRVFGAAGKTVVLHIAVKGQNPGDVKVKVVATYPPQILLAELGEAKATQNGALVLHKLTLTIPPGSPAANHLGSETGKLGRVELETTHPTAKKITLYVQFAVE